MTEHTESADTDEMTTIRPWMYREGYHQLRGNGSWSEWQPVYRDLLDQLVGFRRRRHQPAVRPRRDKRDELESLWAVSILSDAWIAEAQDVTPADEPWSPINRGALSAGDAILADIGLERFDGDGEYSPFHHEIVECVGDESLSTAVVDEALWPGFWFGDLLFRRAGVRLRAPAELIDPVTATTSGLHFCNWREPRKAHDLSHGWGSNSSWGTAFHLFYADDDGFHFNWGRHNYLSDDVSPYDLDEGVDISTLSRYDLEERNRHPPLAERREVLINRSFVAPPASRDATERWVWDDRISLRRSRWPLHPDDVLTDPGTTDG